MIFILILIIFLLIYILIYVTHRTLEMREFNAKILLELENQNRGLKEVDTSLNKLTKVEDEIKDSIATHSSNMGVEFRDKIDLAIKTINYNVNKGFNANKKPFEQLHTNLKKQQNQMLEIEEIFRMQLVNSLVTDMNNVIKTLEISKIENNK